MKTWTDSKIACAEHHADLVSIETVAEFNWIWIEIHLETGNRTDVSMLWTSGARSGGYYRWNYGHGI